MRVFLKYIFLIILFSTGIGSPTFGQKFSVASFRALPNDISAFINPVRDLNNEDCALLKVQGSEDFVFSTPLGVIQRIDNTGEIWLYIPAKSKKITIKHPEWGVLRDYIFPVRIDSHMTYELKIQEPERAYSILPADTIVNTVIDTLVVTRVDTLIVTPPNKRIPFKLNTLATIGYGGNANTLSGGLLITAMKKHGGFLHMMTDFGKVGQVTGECDRYGVINGDIPFYSGKKRHSLFMINAGASHRITDFISVFEGIGYGSQAVGWELAQSEGGGYVKNSFYSLKGVSFEVGFIFNIKRLSLSLSAFSLKGKQWYGSMGIGINIGMKTKKQ